MLGAHLRDDLRLALGRDPAGDERTGDRGRADDRGREFRIQIQSARELQDEPPLGNRLNPGAAERNELAEDEEAEVAVTECREEGGAEHGDKIYGQEA